MTVEHKLALAVRWASDTQHLMRDLRWTICGRPIPVSGTRTVERDEELLCDQCRRGERRA